VYQVHQSTPKWYTQWYTFLHIPQKILRSDHPNLDIKTLICSIRRTDAGYAGFAKRHFYSEPSNSRPHSCISVLVFLCSNRPGLMQLTKVGAGEGSAPSTKLISVHSPIIKLPRVRTVYLGFPPGP